MSTLNKALKGFVAIFLGVQIFTACDGTDLDITQDPNFLSPEEANPDFLLNAVQEDFGRLVDEMGEDCSEVSRILYMNGRTYQQNYQSTEFDAEWEDAYQQILLDLQIMNPIAEEAELFTHIAMGQIIEAYTLVMFVDFFGDIPYTEALQGAEGVFTPALDGGNSIYDAALGLLDQAIANLERDEAASPASDLFYGIGDNDENWIRVANTMKLKIHLNRRLIDGGAVAAFNDIINNQPYIVSTDQDFQFNYGNSQQNPVTRAPHYVDHYTPSGVNAGYMANWLMDYMQSGKVGNAVTTFEAADPRMLYYFYRQSSEVPIDEQLIRCTVEAPPAHYVAGNEVYCSLDNGYWGRDHGNDEGIPPDTQSRTAYGVYPAGGLFDNSSFIAINGVNFGGQGAGITPIFLASGVEFMRAEIAMVQGDVAGAQAAIENGIALSFGKVRGFASLDPAVTAADIPDVALDASYISEVGDLFAAGNTQERWNLLASEYFVVLFGNGIEAYNFYRRTGAPSDIQPNLEPNPGVYIRSFPYPAVAAQRNPNFPQNKQVSVPVFWDNNPADLTF